ncbi:MAG TPA: hypothetical protein VHB02_17840 [Acidimicrobiales bacterium]|nr:hypothetical protein [Acidimicrobiales bacterium]
MTNHPTSHIHRGLRAAGSSRPKVHRQRPLDLQPARYLELDEAHEQAALAALVDLLVPHLDRRPHQDQHEQEETA